MRRSNGFLFLVGLALVSCTTIEVAEEPAARSVSPAPTEEGEARESVLEYPLAYTTPAAADFSITHAEPVPPAPVVGPRDVVPQPGTRELPALAAPSPPESNGIARGEGTTSPRFSVEEAPVVATPDRRAAPFAEERSPAVTRADGTTPADGERTAVDRPAMTDVPMNGELRSSSPPREGTGETAPSAEPPGTTTRAPARQTTERIATVEGIGSVTEPRSPAELSSPADEEREPTHATRARPRAAVPAAAVESPPSGEERDSAPESPAPVPSGGASEQQSEIAVEPGSTFEVRLPGPMWVYLGSDGVVEFIRRATDGDDSLFTFRLPRNAPDGIPVLRFEAQNIATGSIERRLVAIAPADRSPDTVARRGADTAAATPDAGSATGSTGEATPADTRSLSQRVGDALSGSESIAAGDPTLIDELVVALETPTEEAIDAATYLAIVDRLIDEGETRNATALLEVLVGSGWSPYDRLLFRLAQLLEETGPQRDLRRARGLYGELVDGYPLSRYWSEARSRIEYLDRHFFFIR